MTQKNLLTKVFISDFSEDDLRFTKVDVHISELVLWWMVSKKKFPEFQKIMEFCNDGKVDKLTIHDYRSDEVSNFIKNLPIIRNMEILGVYDSKTDDTCEIIWTRRK